jgi:hypothetical protein
MRGYLHWRVLCCGGIVVRLLLLGGFFGCLVSLCRVDLVEGRLGRPGWVETVGHVCGMRCGGSGMEAFDVVSLQRGRCSIGLYVKVDV